MMIGLWLVIGIGVYFLFFNKSNSPIRFPNNKSAEDILNERFINGEVDAETYKEMKETLRK